MNTTNNSEFQAAQDAVHRLGDKKGEISDGYHSFRELYEHRITLYVKLCHYVQFESEVNIQDNPVWKSKLHSNGKGFDGWFLLGINQEKGKQITYHLPISKWDECHFAIELERAPEFDGHNSTDVLNRLRTL